MAADKNQNNGAKQWKACMHYIKNNQTWESFYKFLFQISFWSISLHGSKANTILSYIQTFLDLDISASSHGSSQRGRSSLIGWNLCWASSVKNASYANNSCGMFCNVRGCQAGMLMAKEKQRNKNIPITKQRCCATIALIYNQ